MMPAFKGMEKIGAIQNAVRMPAYDFATFIDWIYSAVVRKPFAGYV